MLVAGQLHQNSPPLVLLRLEFTPLRLHPKITRLYPCCGASTCVAERRSGRWGRESREDDGRMERAGKWRGLVEVLQVAFCCSDWQHLEQWQQRDQRPHAQGCRHLAEQGAVGVGLSRNRRHLHSSAPSRIAGQFYAWACPRRSDRRLCWGHRLLHSIHRNLNCSQICNEVAFTRVSVGLRTGVRGTSDLPRRPLSVTSPARSAVSQSESRIHLQDHQPRGSCHGEPNQPRHLLQRQLLHALPQRLQRNIRLPRDWLLVQISSAASHSLAHAGGARDADFVPAAGGTAAKLEAQARSFVGELCADRLRAGWGVHAEGADHERNREWDGDIDGEAAAAGARAEMLYKGVHSQFPEDRSLLWLVRRELLLMSESELQAVKDIIFSHVQGEGVRYHGLVERLSDLNEIREAEDFEAGFYEEGKGERARDL